MFQVCPVENTAGRTALRRCRVIRVVAGQNDDGSTNCWTGKEKCRRFELIHETAGATDGLVREADRLRVRIDERRARPPPPFERWDSWQAQADRIALGVHDDTVGGRPRLEIRHGRTALDRPRNTHLEVVERKRG